MDGRVDSTFWLRFWAVVVAEFAVFFASAERRALYDYVAGTVVVRDAPYSPATLGRR